MNFRSVIFACLVSTGVMGGVWASDLVGSAFVNVTSDTAANAKNMAMNEALRQVLNDTLAPYADAAALRNAIANEKSAVLTNLIASSGISGERTSDTTYSAKITMTVNKNAAREWMNANDIQNWISVGADTLDVSPVVLVLNNRVADWARLRRVAADAGINLDTVSIVDGRILFNIPRAKRSGLTIALREAGFNYADRDGTLYISR